MNNPDSNPSQGEINKNPKANDAEFFLAVLPLIIFHSITSTFFNLLEVLGLDESKGNILFSALSWLILIIAYIPAFIISIPINIYQYYSK